MKRLRYRPNNDRASGYCSPWFEWLCAVSSASRLCSDRCWQQCQPAFKRNRFNSDSSALSGTSLPPSTRATSRSQSIKVTKVDRTCPPGYLLSTTRNCAPIQAAPSADHALSGRNKTFALVVLHSRGDDTQWVFLASHSSSSYSKRPSAELDLCS